MSLIHLRFTILSSPCVHTNTNHLPRLPRVLNAMDVVTTHHTTTWTTPQRTQFSQNGPHKRHRPKQQSLVPQHETTSVDASPRSLTTSSNLPLRSPMNQKPWKALSMDRPGTTKKFMPSHRSSATGAAARDEGFLDLPTRHFAKHSAGVKKAAIAQQLWLFPFPQNSAFSFLHKRKPISPIHAQPPGSKFYTLRHTMSMSL